MAEETVGAGGSATEGVLRGQSLGPYLIEKQLGRGGMAVVYRATHITLERVVALKVLLPSLSGDDEFVKRFIEEARAAARLDYPHIVPIYDSGEIGGVYYIAMKLLEGRDLKTMLEEQRTIGSPGLPLERSISIASQVAGALEYAHRHRLVHRDVKPANIYVDGYDRVTLTDFGIARALDRSSSTLTGTVIGTPTYMSPEQAQGQVADFRSDIYSLGVVLFEMLTGAPPFSGNPQTVMYAHVFTAPPPVENVKTQLPPGIGEVVARALAKQPEDRYQSAGALALALTNAAGGQLAVNALAAGNAPLAYSDTPATLSGAAAGPISGPHTAVPGGITRETSAQPGVAAPYEERRAGARLPLTALLGGIATAVVVVVAALLWYFLAGPGAVAGDGRLVVNSDPPGAAVTVDGNRLGVTPLGGQRLTAGVHDLMLDKPTYAPVERKEQIRGGHTDTVSAALTSLPADQLLTVTQALITGQVTQSSNGTVLVGGEVTQASIGQPFTMVVALQQRFPGVRDLTFKTTFELLAPDGTLLSSSAQTQMLPKSVAQRVFYYPNQRFVNSASGAPPPAGVYHLKLLIDGHEVAAKDLQLVP